MKKQVQTVKIRITKDIREDVERMGKLLRAVEADPRTFEALMKDPVRALGRHGIELSKYASKAFPAESVAREIAEVARQAVEGAILERIKVKPDQVAETYENSYTEWGHNTNWDRSSVSSKNYESDTITVRGTVSHQNQSANTMSNANFADRSLNDARQEVLGPLLGQEVIRQIQAGMEKALAGKATVQRPVTSRQV